MKTIRIYEDFDADSERKPVDLTFEVPDVNPYDEGYLLAPTQAMHIVQAWDGRPLGDEEYARNWEPAPDGTYAIAWADDVGVSIKFWESTTDFHNWATGIPAGGREDDAAAPAFSTSMWPFTGTFEIEEQAS